MLEIGDITPLDTEVLNIQNQKVKLRDLSGNKIVLYFYPKDNTPGCTQEACDFRDVNEEIENLGAKIIGISADSNTTHQSFVKKYSLSFDLWTDSEHRLTEAFGVRKEKKLFGKTKFSIQRTTFVIDEKGKVLNVWPEVNVKGHTQEVLNFLNTLK